MLGDEVLLAPMLGRRETAARFAARNWTDVRTNAEYRGNQSIEVDAPRARAMFVRNGWIVPLSYKDRMELHIIRRSAENFFCGSRT